MNNYYFIKLYHEILKDPKMGKMPDNLWRRTIELFLLAGECGRDGFLPPIDDMAWVLRQDVDSLESELNEIAQLGIISLIDGSWHVTNFESRQEAVSDAERSKRYRERKRKITQSGSGNHREVTTRTQDVTEEVTEGVTSRDREVDIDIEVDIDKNIPKGTGKPPPKKSKKKKAPKEKIPEPPAVTAYRSVARTYPHKALWPDIAAAVGEKEPDLQFWKDVIKAYIGCGWNRLNIKNQLEFYQNREIPTPPGGKQNGPNGLNKRSYASDEVTSGPTGPGEWTEAERIELGLSPAGDV